MQGTGKNVKTTENAKKTIKAKNIQNVKIARKGKREQKMQKSKKKFRPKPPRVFLLKTNKVCTIWEFSL